MRDNVLELKQYNLPHQGKIIITDKFAYFTPYSKVKHGAKSNIYRYRRGGEMYDNLERQFELYWMAGKEVKF